MKNKNKILVIGPIPEPTTGVSLANKVLIDNLGISDAYKVDFINTSYNKFDEDLGGFSFSKFFFYLKLNLFVLKVFRNDVIYLTPGQTFYGLLKYILYYFTANFSGKEIITHIHGNHFGKEYDKLKGLKKRLFKFLASKTTKGIVLSESLTPNMEAFIEEKNIYVLYNFVEDFLFPTQVEVEKKTTTNFKPKIVFLSNLMEEKGIFSLLEALLKLEADGVEYEAKIAGNIDSKNKQRVESYFNSLKHTSYQGVVKGQDKKKLLLWANIFILPTWYSMEGQPISILEGMATANVILTTNHAGIPDIFKNNENGFYVEKKNHKSIVEAVVKITKDVERTNEIQLFNFNQAREKYKVKSFIKNAISIFNA